MHYYPHHLGDYAKDTGHLSLAEHGAYRLLLDHYYSTETPLPNSPAALYRLCRAASKLERQAVDSVLSQFFTASENGFSNARADKEIEEFSSKSEKAKNAGIMSGLARNLKRINKTARTDVERTLNGRSYERSSGVEQRAIVEPSSNQEPVTSNQCSFSKEPKGGPPEIPETQEKPAKGNCRLPTTNHAKRLASLFRRRLTTEWTQVEITAFKRQQPMAEEDLDAIESYYRAHWPPDRETNVLRHDLKTLFNNWPGEVDRANAWKASVANRATHAAVIPSMPAGLKSFAQIDREAKEDARHGPEAIKMKRAFVWDPNEAEPEPTTTP